MRIKENTIIKSNKSKKIFFFPAVLILLGLIIYSNTFNGPFQFDDRGFIVDNIGIRDIGDIKAIRKSLSSSSRFITFYSFALNYHFHKLDVFGYHVANFVIHLISSFLTWWFVRMLLGVVIPQISILQVNRKGTPSGQYPAFHCETIAFFAGLIFLSHPVQTQAVTYITQRFASLATLFYLASVCFYMKGRLLKGKKSFSSVCFLASAVSAVLSMLSKEIAITLPLIIILIEFFILRAGALPEEKAKMRIYYVWLFLFLLLALLIIPSAFSFNFFNMLFSPRISESHIGDVLTFRTYLLTQLRVFVTFIRLMFVPVNQTLDYDFPMSHAFFEPATFMSFMFLVVVFFVALKLRFKNRLISFGIFWFFLTLSANLIPRRHVIFEHKLYLALPGFCIILCLGLYKIIVQHQRNWNAAVKNKKNRSQHAAICLEKDFKKYVIIVTIIILILSGMAFRRNRVWQDEIALWEDIIKKAPDKVRVLNNLGTIYFDKGDHKKALVHFNRALKINPEYASPYNNRGVIYLEEKLYKLALADFDRALALKPDYAAVYKNKGKIHKEKGKYDLAILEYNKALEINPYFAEVYDNRGVSYGEKGENALALADFKRALEIKPNLAGTYHNRGTVYFRQGKYSLALDDFNRAIVFDPNNADTYCNRGNVYQAFKKYDLATVDYNKALEINSGYFDAYNSIGVTFAKQGMYDLAIDKFNKALKINPGYAAAYNNIGMANIRKGEYNLAIKAFGTAVKINPAYSSAYFNRSIAHQKNGNIEGALEDAVKAKSMGHAVDNNYINNLENFVKKLDNIN